MEQNENLININISISKQELIEFFNLHGQSEERLNAFAEYLTGELDEELNRCTDSFLSENDWSGFFVEENSQEDGE